VRFQHKMSLERVASWRIDNQRARSRETQSGSRSRPFYKPAKPSDSRAKADRRFTTGSNRCCASSSTTNKAVGRKD
jgi:hypothetical protein